MARPESKIILSRHGNKTKLRPDVKSIPGDTIDKHFVIVTSEDGAVMTEQGAEVFGDTTYQNVLEESSEFIRAIQSAHYVKEGGIFVNKPITIINPNLSFVANPDVDWTDKEVYDPNMPESETMVKLFENFYFTDASQPHSPRMALLGQYLMASIIEGIGFLQAKHKEGPNAYININHAPNIDTFAAAALGYLDVDASSRTVRVNDNYRGHVDMGQMFTGNVHKLDTPNPLLELKVQGVEVGMTLKDLQHYQKTFAEHAEMK